VAVPERERGFMIVLTRIIFCAIFFTYIAVKKDMFFVSIVLFLNVLSLEIHTWAIRKTNQRIDRIEGGKNGE
jgi:hypothetical protein